MDGRAATRPLAPWLNLHPTNVAHLPDGKAKTSVVTSSRPAAMRYRSAFDEIIAAHPERAGIRAMVAFSGKPTGKEVMHSREDRIAGGAFLCDDDAEFTETKMDPEARGKDLRIGFDRRKYRVMIVADKYQTGFAQPKLAAMHLHRTIANKVEVAQTLSRLSRTFSGKDQTFVIDFVNGPEAIRKAFARYDAGALGTVSESA